MEILFLLFALGFAVSFFGLGIMFACWISAEIPSAPHAVKGANNEAKRLD